MGRRIEPTTTVDPARREKLIADNLKIVWKFLHRLPRVAIFAVGGLEEAAAILMPNYITAVDAWLDRGEARGYALSTYVFMNLSCHRSRLFAVERHVIKPPVKHPELVLAKRLRPKDEDELWIEDEPAPMENADEFAAMWRAIAELPEPEQRVIFARYGGEEVASYSELGDTMGCSKARIQQLEFAARLKLRERMGVE